MRRLADRGAGAHRDRRGARKRWKAHLRHSESGLLSVATTAGKLERRPRQIRASSEAPISGKFSPNPRNPDDVFIGQTSMYRSTDGGHTWNAFNGAPSGDDFHVIWMSPENPKYMIQGVDQGAIVSEDGGKSWSSWYNQADRPALPCLHGQQFPYTVYAAQQDSGTVGLPSRSDFGEISDNERFSVDGFEAAFIAPDPANPNIVYSDGWYGSVVRFDRTTGQVRNGVRTRGKISPQRAWPRCVFAPQDPRHALPRHAIRSKNNGWWHELAGNKSGFNGCPSASHSRGPRGRTRRQRRRHRHSFAFTKAAGVIWSGATNGRIQVTMDAGANWKDVSPTDLLPAPPATTAPGPPTFSGVQI